MDEVSLLHACLIAFSAVMIILSFLAGAIHLITAIFPDRPPKTDPAMVAAITATVESIYPGARVTRIEEI